MPPKETVERMAAGPSAGSVADPGQCLWGELGGAFWALVARPRPARSRARRWASGLAWDRTLDAGLKRARGGRLGRSIGWPGLQEPSRRMGF